MWSEKEGSLMLDEKKMHLITVYTHFWQNKMIATYEVDLLILKHINFENFL